jgi:hypothetical protein
MKKIIKRNKANEGIKATGNITTIAEQTAINTSQDVKSVAQLMSETEVKFSAGNGATIKTITNDLQAYLVDHKAELIARSVELGKGCGGRLLDETLCKYFAVTGKGLTKYDLQSILIASNSGRSDVNGYCATFAVNQSETSKNGCPSRVKRFRLDGLYCVVPVSA